MLALVRLFVICSDERRRKIVLEVGAAIWGIKRYRVWGKHRGAPVCARGFVFSCQWVDGGGCFCFGF